MATADKFSANGFDYEVVENEEGSVSVTISRGGEVVEQDFFSFDNGPPSAVSAAASWVRGHVEAHDPERPSFEERFAPFGEEWQREWAERGVPF